MIRNYSVLYLHETAEFGGAENSLLNLTGRIDRTKFDPIVACPDNGLFPEKLKKIGIEVYPVAYPPLRRLVGVLPAIKKIRDIIRSRDVRLVHSNSIRTHLYGVIAVRPYGIPTIWHQRNLLIKEHIDPDRLFSLLPDKIICNSRAIADRFLKNGRLPSKVAIIYNGVDTEKFRPSINGGKVREEFRIAPDEIVIGIASRFNLYKGHETFLRAAHCLITGAPEITARLRFLIAGSPVFKEDEFREKHLVDLADKLGIRDKVIFSGFRNDMPEIYAAMDIFVLASDAEPCGRVVLEAMASGKAIVATGSGGTPELIKDNQTGFLFEAGDMKALAGKLAILIRDRSLSADMGAAGRKRAEEDFSIERNIRATEEIYTELLPRSQPRLRRDGRDSAPRPHGRGASRMDKNV